MSAKRPAISRSTQAEHQAVDVDVLPPGDLGVEAGAELDERRYPPVDTHRARRGLSDARDQFQHRALAGSVAPDDAEGLSLLDVERHALQRLEHRVWTQIPQHAARQQRALQRRKLLPAAVAAVDLVNVAHLNRQLQPAARCLLLAAHTSSANVSRRRSNTK